MTFERWLVFALLSAASAALVGVFGKVGMKGVDATLAAAVRSAFMTALLLAVCTAAGLWRQVGSLHGRAVGMIALSGVAGAVSWLFYFKALQAGPLSKVAAVDKLSMPLAVVLAAVLLGERPSRVNWLGIALMVAGAYLASKPANP